MLRFRVRKHRGKNMRGMNLWFVADMRHGEHLPVYIKVPWHEAVWACGRHNTGMRYSQVHGWRTYDDMMSLVTAEVRERIEGGSFYLSPREKEAMDHTLGRGWRSEHDAREAQRQIDQHYEQRGLARRARKMTAQGCNLSGRYRRALVAFEGASLRDIRV